MERNPILHRLTEWAVDHPKHTRILAVLVTLFFAAWIPFIQFEVDFKKFLPENDPAVQALDQAEARYGTQEFLIVVVEASGTIFNAATLAKIQTLEKQFEALPEVDEVQGPTTAQVITGTQSTVEISDAAETVPQTPEEMDAYGQRLFSSSRLKGVVVSEDGTAGAIMIRLITGAHRIDMANRVSDIALAHEGPEKIYVAGLPAMHAAMINSMVRDLLVLVPMVILVVAFLLFFSFRGPKGILVCMPVVGMSMVWTLGLMVMLGQKLTPFAVPLPVMLVAIGIADGIHILNRYYEEANKGLSKRQSILNTMNEMRGPVIMTSLTTAAGFLSLVTSLLTAQQVFGVFIAFGVIVAMFLSLTFIPAMLTGFNPENLPARRGAHHLTFGLAGLARGIYRARIALIVLSLVALGFSAAAVPHLKVETIPRQFLGENHPLVKAMDVVDRTFGGSNQLGIEIDTGKPSGLVAPEVLKAMLQLEEGLARIKGVAHPVSLADVIREMNQKFHVDDPAYYTIPDDPRLAAQLALLFSFQGGDLGQMARADTSSGEVVARVEFLSTGQLAGIASQVQALIDQFPGQAKVEQVDMLRAFLSLFTKMPASQAYSIAVSALAAALIVMLLMRSLVAGLICIVPLIFTVAVNFGIMSWSGMPLDMATLIIASIAIGVGIDYAIHLVCRLRLDAVRTSSLENAFVEAMSHAGKAIFYNAATVTLGFLVLLASNFRGLANLGMLVSLTMILSALSTFTLLPAILSLCRPSFLKKR